MKGRRYLVISYFWAPRLLLRSQATGDEETDRQRQTERERDGSTSNYQPCQGDGRGRGRGEEERTFAPPQLSLISESPSDFLFSLSYLCVLFLFSSHFSFVSPPPPPAFQARAEVNTTWRQVHTPPLHPSQEQKTGHVSWTMEEGRVPLLSPFTLMFVSPG